MRPQEEYDPIGNRIVTTEHTETTEYFANALNQYTNILCAPASLRLNHDADGNLLTNGPLACMWDAENHHGSLIANGLLFLWKSA